MSEESFEPESEIGNIEYKRHLLSVSVDHDRFVTLQSQLKRRMNEGRGEAMYQIGVEDNGSIYGLSVDEFETSVCILKRLVDSVDAEMYEVYQRNTTEGLKYGGFLVRDRSEYVDLVIATGGCVNSGKSTLVGTLSTGELDDGNSRCAKRVFNYAHEVNSGNTSSMAYEIVGIKDTRIVNDELARVSHKRPEWREIISNSTKVITFKDLAGHRPYFSKTTLRGINGGHPDYVIIMFDGTRGDLGISDPNEINKIEEHNLDHLLSGKTKKRSENERQKKTPMVEEHMKLCYIWKIPMIAVISKIDRKDQMADSTYRCIETYMKMLDRKRRIVTITGTEQITPTLIRQLTHLEVMPVFMVSCKSGDNLNLLKHTLSILPQCRKIDTKGMLKFSIEEKFQVKGHGLVVSGYMLSGGVKPGDIVKIGPRPFKPYYVEVRVKNIENKRVPVSHAKAGQFVTINITGIDGKYIRRGMTIVDLHAKENVVWFFKARVQLQSHSTMTVRTRYQSMLHVENVREACQIESIDDVDFISNTQKILDNPACTDIDLRSIGKKVYRRFTRINPDLSSLTGNDWREEATRIFTILKETNGIGPGDIATVELRMLARPVNISDNERFIWSDNFITGVGYVIKTLNKLPTDKNRKKK